MVDLEGLRHRLDASAWLGVGIVGALVFLAGIYEPAYKGVHYAQYIQAGVAIAGGALAVLGLSFWWDQREEDIAHPRRPPLRGRAREIGIAPSLEVYRPGAAIERPALDGESRDPDDDPTD